MGLISLTSIITGRERLPRLIKGLKGKGVPVLIQLSADVVLVERLSILQARLGVLVRRALGRPARLADPHLGQRVVAHDADDAVPGLVRVGGEGRPGVGDGVALPVGEGVDEEDVGGGDDGVCGAVLELVPRVGGAVPELGRGGAEVVDLLDELVAGKGPAVERLGANCDRPDLVIVPRGMCEDGVLVELVRVFCVRPIDILLDYSSILPYANSILTRHQERLGSPWSLQRARYSQRYHIVRPHIFSQSCCRSLRQWHRNPPRNQQ